MTTAITLATLGIGMILVPVSYLFWMVSTNAKYADAMKLELAR